MPALDLAAGMIYWNNSGSSEIRRAKLHDKDQSVLIRELNDPHAVVLDLAGGQIYGGAIKTVGQERGLQSA